MPRPDPLRVWARIAPYQQCKHYEGNGAHRVVEPHFLQRPAQLDVADVAARALRHPVIGPDGQIVAGDTLIGHWLILLSSTPSPRSYRAYPRRGHNTSERYYRSLMYTRLGPSDTLHKTTCCIGPGLCGTSENHQNANFALSAFSEIHPDRPSKGRCSTHPPHGP